jgi:hypothetical protein
MMMMERTTFMQALCFFFLLQGATGLALHERKQATLGGGEQSTGLSVDLLHESQRLINFLKAVHTSTRGALYQQSPVLDCAIRRYKSGWIPLLKTLSADPNEHKDPTELVPPVDIAWIWHVHRLNSNAYAKFVKQEGIDHETFDGAFEQQSDASKQSETRTAEETATQELWDQLHGKNMSFFTASNCNAPNSLEETLPSSFLQGASVRQSKFLWNFLTPNYEDLEFLKGTEGRYVRWLELKAKNPHEQLVPSVPVDLMWHTHMLVSPVSYMQDIQRFGLKQLGHDDTKAQVVLRPQFVRTQDLWAKEYAGTEYEKMIMGAPRRGEPSQAYWSGSLSPLRDDAEGESSFLETNMESGECETSCSSEMR